MNEYLFDVRLFASIRVKATSDQEARELLAKHIDCNDANLGSWENGDPILCEVSLDESEPDIVEVNGEAV